MKKIFNKEFWASLGFLAGVFVLNWLTASRSPVPWYDEVLYISPAVNLYYGDGFISRAWPDWLYQDFWAAYVPLYPLLLFVWMKVFGFSIEVVRCLGYFLACLAAFFLWLWSYRVDWSKGKAFWRHLLTASAVTGFSVCLAYRSGRYDSLAMLVAALALAAFTLSSPILRRSALFVLGMLAVWSSLPLAFFGAGAAGLWCLFFGRARFVDFLTIGLGVFSGFFAIYLVYSHFGVWQQFLNYNLPFTLFGQSFFTKFEFSVPQPLGLGTIIMLYPDIGLLLLLPTLLVFWFKCGERLVSKDKKIFWYLVALSFVPPLTISLIGSFHIMYSWMGYVPLCLCACRFLGDPSFFVGKERLRRGLFIAFTVVILVGLPAKLLVIVSEWKARDYRRVENFVREHIRPGDVVLSNFKSYYAVREVTKDVYLNTYTHLSEEEKNQITAIVTAPVYASLRKEELGGDWEITGSLLLPGAFSGKIRANRLLLDYPKYELNIYRRKSEAAHLLTYPE